jgi:uncharacterized protein involved in exopolysaccharide biosynthesis
MHQLPVAVSTIATPRPLTLRDWVAVGFRHSRMIGLCFLLIFGAVTLITILTPRQYEAELKILVKGERAEPLVSPDKESVMARPEVTEQDVNSEVELLKSRDLLEKVALASGVLPNDSLKLNKAVQQLEKKIIVEPIKKTKLIRVTYKGESPHGAETVLQTLGQLYFEKHLEVHRPPGAVNFFQGQTEEYRKELKETEAAMTKFAADEGVVEAPLSREISVRELNEFEAELKKARFAVAETEQRIQVLEQEQASTDARLTTSIKTTGNPYLEQQLRTTLLSLELKRTELLNKFTPDYRPVQEVEAEIAQAREALQNALNNPVREETTDRDTTHEMIKTELARARADLRAQQAKVESTSQVVDQYREQARKLNETAIAQQDLVRKAKTAEENYLLYSKKEEEARISDALDQQRIVNVSVAQPASAPPSSVSPRWLLNLGAGFFLAICASIIVACTADYLDRSFRTPDEVEIYLNVPVLAALPAKCEARIQI